MSCILYPDFLFSNWILTWYILFICRFTKFNPIYFLSFALFINFLQIIFKILTKNTLENIVFFITIITILKIIPLMTIINSERDFLNDILFGIVLFIIYIIHMCINYYCGRINSKMLEILYIPINQRECRTFLETLPATFRWIFT